MHHPGPPRFITVGEAAELAPSEPDSRVADEFSWTIREAPASSDTTVNDGPVIHVAPDVPGTYRLELDAPDGTHTQTVRAFPDPRRPARFSCDPDALPDHEFDDISVAGTFNDYRFGTDSPRVVDGQYIFETELPPGDHKVMFVPGMRRDQAVDAHCTVEGPEKPRITLDAVEEGREVRIDATALPGPTTDETAADLDVEFYVDDRDALYGDLDVDGDVATLPLSAVEDSVRVHAVAIGARHSVADAVEIGADGTVTHLNDPPEWVEDAVIYEVFTRSFAGAADTTFREIERRVPYLDWLGIDALWLTPILEAVSPQRGDDAPGGPHGYDTIDYFRTADDLGSRENLESLIETLHDHGIRLIFDLVVNHTARSHPHFQLAEAGVPEYDQWYEFEDGAAQFYFNWYNIPNLNYDSLAVREHVLSVIEEWADVVDGFRCDVAWALDPGFWQEVRERVRAIDAEFLLLDETIPRDPAYHELNFDLHYDTTLYGMLRGIGEGHEPADTVLSAVEETAREGFPPHAEMMRYVENHDEPRYLKACGREPLKAATAATMTLPGVPLVYYGQESGMLSSRGDMDWSGDDELTPLVRRLIELRNDWTALRRGDLVEIDWDCPSDRGVAYARKHGQETLVIALNFGDRPVDVWLDVEVQETDLLTGESVRTKPRDIGTTVAVEDVVVLEAVGSK
ncbi:MAG: alpha-amylase family glycosyl hydrolase [Halapricum sp.]